MQLKELSLELTNECRLSCLHCSSGSSLQKLPGELSISKHLEMIDEARALGATTLSLSGGEPLLYIRHQQDHSLTDKALILLMQRAIEIKYEEILLYTTGHGDRNRIYNCRYIDNILSFGDALTFIFSMHSPANYVNDYIMNVPGATDNIKSSIRWLVERGANVHIHMVPMKPNFRHIERMVGFCLDYGVKKLNFLRFVPQTRGKKNKDVLGMTMAEFAEMQFMLHTVVERIKDNDLLEIRLGCPIDFRHAVGLLDAKAKPCHAGDDLILVRPTGDVHPCAAWKSLPCDTNVKDHSLKWIWENSEVFNGIRWFKEYVAVELPDDNPCSSCDMLYSCKTGCPAQRIHAMPELGMDALTCSIYSDPLCPRGNGKLYDAVYDTTCTPAECHCDGAVCVEASCDCRCYTGASPSLPCPNKEAHTVEVM